VSARWRRRVACAASFVSVLLLTQICGCSADELGQGDNSSSSRVTAIAAAGCTVYALTESGRVWAWGGNTVGQLGLSITLGSETPAPVVGLTDVVDIVSGRFFACALKSDGTVWVWGDSPGISSPVVAPTPFRMPGLPLIASIQANDSAVCAVARDGTVWDWGLVTQTQEKLGSAVEGYRAVSRGVEQIPGLARVKSISLEEFWGTGPYERYATGGLAIKTDGTVWAWRTEYDRGNWPFGPFVEVGPIHLARPAKDVASSGVSSYVLDEAGALWDLADPKDPVKVPGASGVTFVADTPSTDTYFIADGQVYTLSKKEPSPRPVPGLDQAAQVASGEFGPLILRTDGTVWSVGSPGESAGAGSSAGSPAETPLQVAGLPTVTKIATCGYSSYALASDGTVWSWGNDWLGQLGQGAKIWSASPVQIPVTGKAVAITAAGMPEDGTGCVLTSDGAVWTWGSNGYGLLGLGAGNPLSSLAPVEVTGLSKVTAIAGGAQTLYALDSTGQLFEWGYRCELPWNQPEPQTSTPIKVAGLPIVTAVASTDGAGYALDADGCVWVWGKNWWSDFRPIKVKVQGLPVAAAIAASDGTCLALGADGSVWNLDSDTAPTLVEGLPPASAIAAGSGTGYALVRDGTVWAWGDGELGQLGSGPTKPGVASGPVMVPGLADVVAIAAGPWSAYALTADGTVWAWGYNSYGQLGAGAAPDSTGPVQVIFPWSSGP